MAEIKRYRSQQVFTQPVGVVRSTGAEAASRAWMGVADAGQRMFEMGYAEAKAQQTALGDNFAAISVIGKDDEGNYESIAVPNKFSPVARQRAEAGLQKRYVEQFAEDVNNAGKLLYAQYKEKGDTQSFLNDWDAFSKGQIKAVAQDEKLARFAPLMSRMLDSTGKSHLASLHGIQRDLADRKAYQTSTGLIEDSINNIAAVAASGAIYYDEVGDDAAAPRSVALDQFKETLDAIDNLANEFPNRLEATTIPNMKRKLRKAYYEGQQGLIIANLNNAIERVFPTTFASIIEGTDHKGNVMQSGLAAFQRGNVNDVKDPNVRQILIEAGLTNEYFAQEGMSSLLPELNNAWSKAQGQFAEDWNKQLDGLRVHAYSAQAQAGIPIGAKEGEKILSKRFGINNEVDLANNLPRLLKDSEAQNLLMYSKVLPDVVQKALSRDFAVTHLMESDAKTQRMWLDFFRQTTMVQNGKYIAGRGLSKDTMMFWSELDAYTKAGQTMSLAEYVQLDQQIAMGEGFAETVAHRVTQFIGVTQPYKSKDAAVAAFVGNVTDNDPDLVGFFTPMADNLILKHGAAKAEQIIKQNINTVFAKSDMMADKDKRTLFAPELFYAKPDMMVFTRAAEAALNQAQNAVELQLGKNVGLVPDRRGSAIEGLPTRLPTYTLQYTDPNHPRFGMPVMGANGPIEIGPNAVIAARQLRSNKSLAEIMAEVEQHWNQRWLKRDKLGRNKPRPSASFGYNTRFKTMDDVRAAQEANQ